MITSPPTIMTELPTGSAHKVYRVSPKRIGEAPVDEVEPLLWAAISLIHTEDMPKFIRAVGVDLFRKHFTVTAFDLSGESPKWSALASDAAPTSATSGPRLISS